MGGKPVEIDETYIGDREKNKHSKDKLRAGHGTVGKTAVFGMLERDGAVVAMHRHVTEFSFRHNAAKIGTMDFIALTIDGAANRRLTYKDLKNAA